uniref:Uncharacterized protein n=1 Tax=Knipowitschia caucasica TaxID=637954 RepID=A0AAV2KEA9_KNICA
MSTQRRHSGFTQTTALVARLIYYRAPLQTLVAQSPDTSGAAAALRSSPSRRRETRRDQSRFPGEVKSCCGLCSRLHCQVDEELLICSRLDVWPGGRCELCANHSRLSQTLTHGYYSPEQQLYIREEEELSPGPRAVEEETAATSVLPRTEGAEGAGMGLSLSRK